MRMKTYSFVLTCCVALFIAGCSTAPEKKPEPKPEKPAKPVVKPKPKPKPKPRYLPFNAKGLVAAAKERCNHKVKYDGRYVPLRYPMGDVPNNIGVCTDVVVRAYRRQGIDLQKNVHEDMKRAFNAYPSRRVWGKLSPDANIDHRRVLNLETYFKRHGQSLPLSRNPAHYKPGDLVTWRIGGVAPHIGIVIDKKAKDGKTPLIVHNDSKGPVVENILFDPKFTLVGHYRYWPGRRIR